LVATFAAVLPAFFIIVGIIVFLQHLLTNSYVNAVLQGLKNCVTGIILATGVHMVSKNCLLASSGSFMPDLRAVAVTAVLAGVYFGLRAWEKKKLSPIQLIGISAVVGMIVYR
jgi:chromate transporter